MALEVDGHGMHPRAWRYEGRASAAAPDVEALWLTVAAAQAAGIALVTFDDSPLPLWTGGHPAGRLEAGVRAPYLSTRTDRVGLAPTLHVATAEPFHLATQLASLDHASKGRAAWVVGATNGAEALATIGCRPFDVPDELRREVADVVEVVRQLWDSWEDDAIIRNVATGRFLAPDRVHHVNFAGASFTVVGPLIRPRPPQGQVVILGSDALGVTGQWCRTPSGKIQPQRPGRSGRAAWPGHPRARHARSACLPHRTDQPRGGALGLQAHEEIIARLEDRVGDTSPAERRHLVELATRLVEAPRRRDEPRTAPVPGQSISS